MAKRSKKPEKFHGLDTSFRLKEIKPLTETQEDVFDAWEEGYNLMLHGVAGTGKTFLALYLAFKEMISSDIHHKVYVVRSSVSSREIGFLPGNPVEKMQQYELPYKSITNDLWSRGDAYDICKSKGSFEFISTSFLRGITFNNCIIVVDEIQNMSKNEIVTIMTRIGKNCKLILAGDTEQDDLVRKATDSSWLPALLKIIDDMDCFETIEFDIDDIVRSGLVKEFILAKRKWESSNSPK